MGKRIEVLAFEVTDTEPAPDAGYEARLARIKRLFADQPLDLSNFKFDRNDANTYDDE